jgi:uncharacterized LabA/DUF88 family protein
MGCETAFGRFCFFCVSALDAFLLGDSLNIWAYIDGFNLYNGALKGTAYKWLNLQAFAQSLRPTDQVSTVKYFTARVDARPNDPTQPFRQILYWRALRTVGTIEIVEGRFLTRKTRLPDVADADRIAALQRAGVDTTGMMPKMAYVYRSEEKGTDVNLAVHLIHDAHMGLFDAAIVLSNDSDLVGAIHIVRQDIHKPVFAFHPQSAHPSDQLRKAATRFRAIQTHHLSDSQFPPVLTDARGSFQKPPAW